MKRFVAVFLLACFACYGAQAETGEIATRAWVVQQFKKIGISYRDLNVTITSNADNTVTFRSDWQSETITNATAISLTMTAASVVTTLRTVNAPRSRNLFFELLFPTVYADSGSTSTKITITLKSGYWVDKVGNQHPFNIGSGITFTLDDELDEVPSSAHVCEVDTSDCNCKYSKMSAEEKEALIPDEYADFTVADWSGFMCDITCWIDEENWSDKTTTRKGTTYWITDDDGVRVSLNEVVYSDAWSSALLGGLENANAHQKECRDAFLASLTCNKTNPQHNWSTTTCGSHTWKECTRNSSHTEGTAEHEYNSTANNGGSSGHYYTCKCGKGARRYEPHTVAGGTEKLYDKDSDGHIIGWKIPGGSCSKCSYSTASIVHTCLHIYCGNCEGGDDCTLPCQYCDGEHNFSSATASKCAYCKCPNCGVHPAAVGPMGDPSFSVEGHGGFGDCGGDDDHITEPENERGGNHHCVCRCGYNGCATTNGVYLAKYGITCGAHAEGFHTREDYATPRYEDCTELEDPSREHHWAMDKSPCTNPGCGAKYGAKEEHEYGEGADEDQAGKATYVDNENCKWIKSCTKCEHKTDEESHPHVALGDVIGHYFHTTNEVRYCNHEYQCKNCLHSFYEDAATSSNACGNVTCSSGHIDGTPTHKDYTDNEDSHDTDTETGAGGTHTCACGGKTEEHSYGAWSELSRADGKVTYIQICNECQHEHTETKDEGEAPSGGILFPIGGCCGAWIMGVDNVESNDTTSVSNQVWEGGIITNYVWVSGWEEGQVVGHVEKREVYFPTAHRFGWRDTSPRCMVCTNMNPLTSAICGTNSTEEAGHCGWHDVDGLCTCECAYTNLAHTAGAFSNIWISVLYTNLNDGVVYTNCYEKRYCDRQSEIDDNICGAVTNVLGEHAWKDNYSYHAQYVPQEDGTTNIYCRISQTCKHADEGGYCYYNENGGLCCGARQSEIREHYPVRTGRVFLDIDAEGGTNETLHIVEEKCDHSQSIATWRDSTTGEIRKYSGCGAILRDSKEAHTMTDWEYYAYVDETNHKVRSECYDPATSNGCGFVQYMDEEHTVQTLGPWIIAGDLANHAYTNTCELEGCPFTNGWTGAHVFSDERWAYNSTVHWTEIACTGGVTGAGCNLTITNSTPEEHIGCCTNCICGFVTDHLALTNIVTETNKYCQASLGGGAPGCGALITGKVYTHHCNKCGEDIDQSVEWDPHECINGVKVWGDGVFSWACPEDRAVNGYAGPGGSVQCDFVTSVSSSMSAYDWPPTSNTCASATFSGMFFSVASNGWYKFECTCDDNGEFFGSKSYWVPKQDGVAGHTQNEAKSYYLYGGKAYALGWSASSDSGLFSFSIDRFAEPCAAPKNSSGGLSLSTSSVSTSSVGGGSSSTPTNGVYTTIRSITPLYDGETGAPLTE